MKRLYLILTVIVALFVFASLAAAGPFPTWDKVINSPGRFKLVMGGAAVFDKETGLVWEQSPGDTDEDGDVDNDDKVSWNEAHNQCVGMRNVGNRRGWRLPTIQELLSLVDPSNPTGNPDLPLGHPFNIVQQNTYWSATTNIFNTSKARAVTFSNGLPDELVKADFVGFVWCVRGGQGADTQ